MDETEARMMCHCPRCVTYGPDSKDWERADQGWERRPEWMRLSEEERKSLAKEFWAKVKEGKC